MHVIAHKGHAQLRRTLAAALVTASLAHGAGDALDRAMAHAEAGDTPRAVATLEQAIEAGDRRPRLRAALGAFYLDTGRAEDALATLLSLVDGEHADAAVLYNAGRAALALGEEARGTAWLERSVAVLPNGPAARFLGLRAGGRGKLVRAYRLLGPWVTAHPDDREARLALALTALRLERFPDVRTLLEPLPEDDPRVRLLHGDLALAERHPDRTVEWLLPIVDTVAAPMDADVRQVLATAYLELGRAGEAVALLDAAAHDRPRASRTLALALHQQGATQRALAVLAPHVAALEADTTEPGTPAASLAADLLRAHGRLLLTLDRVEAAHTSLARAAEHDPWNEETLQLLAQAQSAVGDRDAARLTLARFEALRQAAEAARIPGQTGRATLDDATGRQLAAALEWLARGEPKRAHDVVQREIALAPDDPRPRLLEIRILFALRDLEQAGTKAAALAARFPQVADAHHMRALASMAHARWDEAERGLRQALAIDPDHRASLADLALVLDRRGATDDARALLERLLRIAPGDPLAEARLAQLGAS